MTVNVIETEELTKYLGNKPVVNRVNLHIPEGSIYGIVGPNGAGKSTLLKLIIGYYWPTSGLVRVKGETVTRDSASLRQTIQLVSAEWEFFNSFRIRDLIKYYSLLYYQFDQTRCARLLNALELSDKLRVRSLSLGMKAQLRLALSLASRPSVLLLDEPTNGLDPVVKRQFLQLIVQEAAMDGTTILIATHHLDDLDRIADGVAVMYKGQLIASEMMESLKTKFREIQLVLPSGIPDSIRKSPAIVSIEQKGNYYTITVNGHLETILGSLQEAGALHLEVTDLPFDELFLKLMAQEGYARESLLL